MPREARQRLASAIHRLLCGYAPPAPFLRAAYVQPRKVVLLTAAHEGRGNVWPIDWHTPVSSSPSLYLISLTPDSFGTELIRASGVFVVNFMPAGMEAVVLKAGSMSGRAIEKFSALGLGAVPCRSVAAQYLADAVGHIECRVESTNVAGDHLVLVGRVCYASPPFAASELYHETPIPPLERNAPGSA